MKKINKVLTDQQDVNLWVPENEGTSFFNQDKNNRFFILEIKTLDTQGRKSSFKEVALYPEGFGNEVIEEIYCRSLKGRIVEEVVSRGGGVFHIDEESGKIIINHSDTSNFGNACRSDLIDQFPFAENLKGVPATYVLKGHENLSIINTGVTVFDSHLLNY